MLHVSVDSSDFDLISSVLGIAVVVVVVLETQKHELAK